MKTTQKTVAWLVAVFIFMALGMVFTFWSYGQIENASNHRRDSRIVITAADDFLSSLTVAETSQRGYALTGDRQYLTPYPDIRDNIKSRLAVLRQLTTSAPAQQHVDVVIPLLDAKLAEMDKTIALRRDHDGIGALSLINNDEGQRLVDAIRKEIGSYVQIETDILASHDAQFDANMRRMFRTIIGIGVLALLMVLYFAYANYRAAQHRLKNTEHTETRHLLDEQLGSNVLLQAMLRSAGVAA